MRLIDADSLKQQFEIWDEDDEVAVWSIMNEINSSPTIELAQKKGEWIVNGDIPKECPFCGEDWDKYVFGDVVYTGELPKFCPNCGSYIDTLGYIEVSTVEDAEKGNQQ